MQIQHDPDAPEFSPTLLQNEITFHLGASTETQAVAEGWTLYLLWKHPVVLKRLRDEIERVVGDTLVSADHVPGLTYARQVMQETLRLYPPVFAVVRDAVRPADLTRHSARVGETFLISVYGLHRNPRLWDDPNGFNPDRFHPHRAGTIGRYQYLPFGAGRHVCIGQHMSLPAMVLAVAQFAQRFDWTFSDRDIQPVAQPSLKPSGTFTVRLTRRR
jgi:cytochrome P450